MAKVIKKYKNIYIFILILSLLGLSTGYMYYKTQPNETKKELMTTINIKEELQYGVNNLPKRITFSLKTLIYGVTIIPQLINIFNIFYLPFQTGFIFNLLESFSLKFSLIYISIYHLVPLLFNIFLIKISLTISHKIIEVLIYKDKISIKELKKQIKKYILMSLFLFLYEFLIIIFSTTINGYLMTIIN